MHQKKRCGTQCLRIVLTGNGLKHSDPALTIKATGIREAISIEHLGMVKDGKEDTTSEEVKSWAGAFENYTFKAKNGSTEVLVDIDVHDEYKEMFQEMWPKALKKLKDLAEK
jgi:hypothetical protein